MLCQLLTQKLIKCMQICKSTFKANLFKHTPTNYVKQRCSENIFPQNDFLRYIMLLQCNFCTCLILSLFCIYLFHAVVGTNYEWHNFLFAFHHYQIAFHLPNQRDLRPLTLVSSKYHYPSHWSLWPCHSDKTGGSIRSNECQSGVNGVKFDKS